MKNEWSRRTEKFTYLSSLVLASFPWCFLVPLNSTKAQIVPDDTLGADRSVVAPNDQIDGGAVRGVNLFHSFSDFNVKEGQAVYFTKPAGIENIVSRVTGSHPSNILGKLGVLEGNANLFLINPNGIIFGPKASLDVGGSFIASTASSLVFENGLKFSATNPKAPSLLTINVPIGLQFGAAAEKITNQSGPGYGIQIQSGKTLALVGGDVFIEGGGLFAPGGRIELGSVAANSFVDLTSIPIGWALGYKGTQIFQDIHLSERALVKSSTPLGSPLSSGDILLRGRHVILTKGSEVTAYNGGVNPNPGGSLTVIASKSVEVSDGSGLYNPVSSGTGAAGGIKIETKRFIVRDSTVQSSTLTAGRGGDLTVNASEFVEVDGSGKLSKLTTQTSSNGKAGDVHVTTARLVLRNGGQITTQTSSNGKAGDVHVTTARLVLRNGGQITSSTNVSSRARSRSGDAGSVFIDASESAELSGKGKLPYGENQEFVSGLFSLTQTQGNGGTITVNTGRLVVEDGATISVAAEAGSTGNAGNIDIQKAQDIRLDNGASITANTLSGEQGNITLHSRSLIMRHNSNITTDASGTATGGNISVDTGVLAALENSNIKATAVQGKGGSIQISSQGLFLSPDSKITATSERGINGVVNINAPDVNPSQGLLELPSAPGIPAPIQGCQARGGKSTSSFVNTGSGGLPPNPTEPLSSSDIWEDVTTPSQIVEAQGWIINKQGKVVLVAPAASASKVGCQLTQSAGSNNSEPTNGS